VRMERNWNDLVDQFMKWIDGKTDNFSSCIELINKYRFDDWYDLEIVENKIEWMYGSGYNVKYEILEAI